MSQASDTIFDQAQAGGDGPEVDPTVPSITVKPGWATSQGQMTGVFVLAMLALAGLFGWKLTESDARTAVEAVTQGVLAIGALVAAWRQLATYTNSRGKTASNAVWANAEVMSQARGFGGLGKLGGKLGDILKDPRLQTGLTVGSALGVPGAGAAGEIVDRLRGGGGMSDGDLQYLLAYLDNVARVVVRLSQGETFPAFPARSDMKLPDAVEMLARAPRK